MEENNKDIQNSNINEASNPEKINANIFDTPSVSENKITPMPNFEENINQTVQTGNIFDIPNSNEPKTLNIISEPSSQEFTEAVPIDKIKEENNIYTGSPVIGENIDTINAQKSNEINQTSQTQAEQKQEQDVEILDLNEEPKTEFIEPQAEETPHKRKSLLDLGKENKIILLILIGIVIFAFMLPTITSWFSKNSIFTYTGNMEEIKNTDTIDGMLEIGTEKGTITAKNIRFYNFTKKTNNQITVVYLPESGINDVKDKNIFIELYNKNKNVVYRTQFLSDKKLERKVQGVYTLNVNNTLYKEAVYGKIVVITEKEFAKGSETLACTIINKENEYEIENKITYNFSNQGLTSYVVSRKINNSDTEEISSNIFEKEEAIINKTNISDLVVDNDKIQYTIDLQNFDSKNSGYTTLYTKGSLKRQVSLSEEEQGWSCK